MNIPVTINKSIWDSVASSFTMEVSCHHVFKKATRVSDIPYAQLSKNTPFSGQGLK